MLIHCLIMHYMATNSVLINIFARTIFKPEAEYDFEHLF